MGVYVSKKNPPPVCYTDGGLKRGERKETTQEKCTERVVPPGVAEHRERPVKEYAK